MVAVPAWTAVLLAAFTSLHVLREEQGRVLGMVAITTTLWGLMKHYVRMVLSPDRLYSSGFRDGMKAGIQSEGGGVPADATVTPIMRTSRGA